MAALLIDSLTGTILTIERHPSPRQRDGSLAILSANAQQAYVRRSSRMKDGCRTMRRGKRPGPWGRRMTSIKKKVYSVTFVKVQSCQLGSGSLRQVVGITVMGSCSEGKRLSPSLSPAWASGNLFPTSRMCVHG